VYAAGLEIGSGDEFSRRENIDTADGSNIEQNSRYNERRERLNPMRMTAT